MVASFDTLGAAEALEQSGVDMRQARTFAAQMKLAAAAGDPVPRTQFDAAIYKLRSDISRVEASIGVVEASVNAKMGTGLADLELRLRSHLTSTLWRLFGGLVALFGLVLAVLRFLP